MIRHRLIRPEGFDADQARRAALALASMAPAEGGREALAEALRAAGLLYDPQEKTPAYLGSVRTHPYGRRDMAEAAR